MIHVKSAMLLLCLAALGFAQDRGTVRGTVSDPTGASVPDAIVTARNVDTGLTQTVRTGAAGGLSNGESYRLDGAESQSERRNDPSFNAVSVEALEEFKVQSGAFSAEFGRTSNGVVNFVTRSG